MSSIIQTHPKDPLTAIVHSREAFLWACRELMDYHAVLWPRPQLLTAAQRLYDDIESVGKKLDFIRANLCTLNDRLELLAMAKASLDENATNLFSNIPLVRDDFLLANDIISFEEKGYGGVQSMPMYHERNNSNVPIDDFDEPHVDTSETLYYQMAGARLRIHPDPKDLSKAWKAPCASALLMRTDCHHSRAPSNEMIKNGRLAINYYA